MLLARHEEGFVSFPAWCTCYDLISLLFVPILPIFSYRTRVYINCRDDKACVKMISRLESALLTMVCYFAVCRNGTSSDSSGVLLFHHHCGSTFVSVSSGVLEEVGVLGLNSIIGLDG